MALKVDELSLEVHNISLNLESPFMKLKEEQRTGKHTDVGEIVLSTNGAQYGANILAVCHLLLTPPPIFLAVLTLGGALAIFVNVS